MNTELKKSNTAVSEEEVLSFWEENNIFQKSLEKDSPHGEFVFYDGPPFATGLPHYGHLLTGAMKDIIPRYKTMQGYHIARTWGWDCHGLPVENLIEKELGLSNKKDIEDYGIEKFNEAARASVLRYEQEWKRYIPRSGRWIDMEHPYMSMQPSYMESVWWIFNQLNEKGLTKQGFKAMHLCPRCETTLANFEVNQGYQDVTDISVTAQFKVVGEEGTYFLAWTTTPWTLPGNVVLAVGEDISYVKVKSENSFFYVAEALCESVFSEREYEIVETLSGNDLVGKMYEPVFDYYQKQGVEHADNGWKIYAADFVTTEDGTGIVHIAPAFGSDDMELGKTHSLPFVQHVARNASFVDDFAQDMQGESFKGRKVKAKGDLMSMDIEIIKWLAHNGKLFSKKKLIHSYPHCWRCDTPLLNYATTSWFVDVPAIKDRLVTLNKGVNWVPDHVGEGRFGNWLEGARDWAVSRSRFWGTPLPVWNNESGTETLVLGSVAQLLESVQTSGNTYFGIRHGQSQSNLSGEINADESVENGLTELGVQQVHDEAELLKEKNIDYLFVSPLQRTQETAHILKTQLGLDDSQVIVDSRIRERTPGKTWEGKLWSDAHSQEQAAQGNNFWDYRLSEDAESISDIYVRSMEFLFDIEKKYANKNIVIISHGGVLKTMAFALQHHGDKRKAQEYFNSNPLPTNADVLTFDFKPFPHNDNYVLDLHRPYLDTVNIVSSTGEPMTLLGDVFDVWFDSGCMPYAQIHYPFESHDDFQEKRFPAQYIAEGLDQTRGWFYVLSVLGVALFDTIPFENVIVNGLVLAEDGKKMSKSLNNYPDPYSLFDTVGADAIRLYLLASPVVRGEEFSFSEKAVREVGNKVMGRTRNIVSFYTTYKNDIDHSAHFNSGHPLDVWIAARTHQLIGDVSKHLDAYELDKAARPLFDFVDDFSTWYVRRSRDRYKSEDETDKELALSTTRMVITKLAQVMAVLTPFVAEELWQELRKDDDSLEESVHLSLWPSHETQAGDELVLETMKRVRELVSEGLQLRSDAGIKVRQPLQSLRAPLTDIPMEYHELVLEELNVKELIDGELMLDTDISPILQREGVMRELLRQIQSLRKNNGLEPHDVVALEVQTDKEGSDLITFFNDEICSTAGLSEIVRVENDGETIEIDSMMFVVRVRK